MRVALAIAAVMLLSGCVPSYITVRSTGDSPDAYERNSAYYRCVSEDDDKVDVRISCTAAVYGGKQ